VFRIPPDQVENFIKTYSTDRVTVPPVGRLRFELYKIYFTDGMNFIGGKRVIIGPDGGVTPIQISKFEGSSTTQSGYIQRGVAFHNPRMRQLHQAIAAGLSDEEGGRRKS
jgi:hypothetical protein